jgi:ketosteroid isomerase-like protein
MTTATLHPLVDAITHALESGDRDELASLYAPDAVFVSVGGSHPPAHPARYEGADAIGEYIRGIPTEIRVSVEDHLVGTDGRLALRLLCRLPDGGSVITALVITTDDRGRVVRHEAVEAVDL